jgi:hypothetical protein
MRKILELLRRFRFSRRREKEAVSRWRRVGDSELFTRAMKLEDIVGDDRRERPRSWLERRERRERLRF